jgi:hypothetical protein
MQGLQQEQEQNKNKLASLQWCCASFCSFFSLYVMNVSGKGNVNWSLNQYRDKSRCGALSTSSSAKSHQINIIALSALPTDQEH